MTRYQVRTLTTGDFASLVQLERDVFDALGVAKIDRETFERRVAASEAA